MLPIDCTLLRVDTDMFLPRRVLAGMHAKLTGQLGCRLVSRTAAKATLVMNTAPNTRRFRVMLAHS